MKTRYTYRIKEVPPTVYDQAKMKYFVERRARWMSWERIFSPFKWSSVGAGFPYDTLKEATDRIDQDIATQQSIDQYVKDKQAAIAEYKRVERETKIIPYP